MFNKQLFHMKVFSEAFLYFVIFLAKEYWRKWGLREKGPMKVKNEETCLHPLKIDATRGFQTE